MIAIARENCPEAHFEVADMTIYRPERQFDLVTCTGDAINHIPDLADVKRYSKMCLLTQLPVVISCLTFSMSMKYLTASLLRWILMKRPGCGSK